MDFNTSEIVTDHVDEWKRENTIVDQWGLKFELL